MAGSRRRRSPRAAALTRRTRATTSAPRSRSRRARIFAGCNVENASYGLALCAERSAIVQMVAAGERDPVALAVVTRGPRAGTPCGMCRQTLAEFAADLPIVLLVEGDPSATKRSSLAELLPDAFRADALG